MTSLLLAILFASAMYIIFKISSNLGLKPFPIILINYATCVSVSSLIWKDDFPHYMELINGSPTLYVTLFTGMCFIGAFYLMGLATGLIGVASATTISRMSMIFPTAVTVLVFHEKFNWINGIGFLLSILVIYLIVIKGNQVQTINNGTKQETEAPKKYIFLSLAMFLGFGLCDIMNKTITRVCFDGHFQPLAMFFIYSGALITAVTVTGINLLKNKKEFLTQFKPMTFPLGFILGCVNLGALFFFLKALTDKSLSGPAVFSINSVGILTFSTAVSILFFKDKLNKFKMIGIALAIVCILLLNWKG